MPKVKTATELDAEIEALKKDLQDKQKAVREARRREKTVAEQAKAIEEAEFNRDFVTMAKEIYLSDYEDDGSTVC